MNKVVVYASDGNDINMLRASIFSVRKFLGDEVKIYVLSEELTDSDFNNVTVIDPHELLDSVGFHGRHWNRKWPYPVLFRMMIPLSEEFQQYEKVLYLDTDTLVVSDKINELFELDAEGCEIVGSRDSFGTFDRIKKCIYKDLNNEASAEILKSYIWNNDKIENSIYVNAGVTVWCVKNILKNGLDFYKKRLKWFWDAELRKKFDFLDQDFINSMMKVYRIQHKNFNTFMNHAVNDPKSVVIKHFISGSKPNFMPTAYSLGYAEDNKDNKNIIVYASDGNDSKRLALSIKSVRKYIGENVKICILTRLKEYPGVKGVTLLDPSKIFNDIGIKEEDMTRKRWPYEAMFRLALPLMEEFKDIEKILYLDTDTLIMSRKALRLFNIRPNGYEVFGAPDVDRLQNHIDDIAHEIDNRMFSILDKRIWIPNSKKCSSYINSGVIVMCLNAIRDYGIEWYKIRLKNFWNAFLHGKFKFPDQDFINAFLKVSPSISKLYNRLCGDRDKTFYTDCVIQHFVGKKKLLLQQAAKYLGIET